MTDRGGAPLDTQIGIITFGVVWLAISIFSVYGADCLTSPIGCRSKDLVLQTIVQGSFAFPAWFVAYLVQQIAHGD